MNNFGPTIRAAAPTPRWISNLKGKPLLLPSPGCGKASRNGEHSVAADSGLASGCFSAPFALSDCTHLVGFSVSATQTHHRLRSRKRHAL